MDIRADITNTIITMLEQGAGDWQRPWTATGVKGLPRNFESGRAYTGVNVLLFWHAAKTRGYERNEWLTFRQAQAIGASVRKGAKGVMGMFYKTVECQRDGADADEGEEGGRRVPMLKPFWVFNVADIENLPAQPEAQPAAKAFEPVASAEQLLNASGATIISGGDRACYSVDADTVRMPARERFSKAADYYATATHELVHWTGHPERLARTIGKRFGDQAYAFEELVAELGSAFICADVGLDDYTLQGHANYLGDWLRVLRADKTAIFTAARHASAAHAYIADLAARAAAH